MMNYLKTSIAVLLASLLVSPAYAQSNRKSGKPKRTTINFEDQLIKGQNQKPDLLYLLQKKQFNYKRLIRLRENFLPEMRETATEIEEGSRIQLKRPDKE
jgi:hypothetical protein